MTAHPKVDPVGGELVFFGCGPVRGRPSSAITWPTPRGCWFRTEEVDLPRAVMIHDFGVTSTRVVFPDLPVVFRPRLAAERALGSVPVDCRGGCPGRIMPRNGGNADVGGSTSTPPTRSTCSTVTTTATRVVWTWSAMTGRSIRIRAQAIASGLPTLARWRIGPGRKSGLRAVPRRPSRSSSPVSTGRSRVSHRYGTAVAGRPPEDPTPVGFDQVRTWCATKSTRFEPGEHRAPGEPVFVRAQDGHAEDEGWILTVVYDATRGCQ